MAYKPLVWGWKRQDCGHLRQIVSVEIMVAGWQWETRAGRRLRLYMQSPFKGSQHLGTDIEQVLSYRESSSGYDVYLSLPEDVSIIKWKVTGARYRRERRAAAGTILPDWRSQSDDKNTHAEIHLKAHESATQTKVTKYQRVKVTDRLQICIRQDPIVEQSQKGSDSPGWPEPFVTRSHRPGETDR